MSKKFSNKPIRSFCDNITVRGTMKQVADKWQQLYEEAATAGDRVLAERYRQQAEHYIKEMAL